MDVGFPETQRWLPLPRPTPLDSSLSMGRLGKEGISQVAPGKTVRELPKLPVARPTPARGVARGGGEVSGLFLTCRRSFHLAAPKGAESAGPGAGPPLAGPPLAGLSPEEHSASLASASVTPDSIPLEPLLHGLPPPRVSPARTCLLLPCQDLSSRASLPLPSPKSAFPVCLVSLATRPALLTSLHHFAGGHLE